MLHWTNASSADLLTPEFSAALFAPAAPLDTTRYFVIIPDDVGHGQSSKPSDGFKAGFPHYGYGDMVDLQHKLVTATLGIQHLHAVVGMSMGCMNAWQWAEAYPEAMDGVMPIACFPSPIAGRNLLWRRMLVNLITSDPQWQNGNYHQQPPSLSVGLQLARMMIDGVPALQVEASTIDSANHLIAAVKSQVPHQDANDVLYAFESSADFNAEKDLGAISAKVYALNFADDEFYRDTLGIVQRDLPQVKHARLQIRPTSAGSAGHLTMAHPRLWSDEVRAFMDWLGTP